MNAYRGEQKPVACISIHIQSFIVRPLFVRLLSGLVIVGAGLRAPRFAHTLVASLLFKASAQKERESAR